MIRIIKKWYFKIYHLLKFLGIFLLIFGFSIKVKAEITYENYQQQFKEAEVSCSDNIIPPYMINGQIRTNGTGYSTSNGTVRASYIVPVKTNTKYYMYSKFGITTQYPYMYYLNENKTALKYITLSFQNGIAEFTTESNTRYIAFQGYAQSWSADWNLLISERNNIEEFIEYKTVCITPTPEPTPTPTPEINEAYTGFLSLYYNKMSYLAEGFTRNNYLKAMIGIIFAWVVLELLLKILNLKRGGKK